MDMKAVYNIQEGKDGKSYWTKIGVGFTNKDGSINVVLQSLPLDGKLHIREMKKKEDRQTDYHDVEANARLIAAAPSMLSALKECAKQLRLTGCEGHSGANCYSDQNPKKGGNMDMKAVYNIQEGKDGKSYWTKIGVGFTNKDGSINVVLQSLPLDGKLHIREMKKKEDRQTDYHDGMSMGEPVDDGTF